MTQEYKVLARKYRPQNFDELIGQEALVRTLKNAIDTGRIAHAFMLTGVRGVGKTTTARIIAKALNHSGGPTTGPTDDCDLCKAISEDRHPDVIEMDAASRTGIDDIREILDGVRYAPTEARFKVYIIDEVHMLSKQAFNALLKTLEEPPPHVKFIFATTEIRKVPITVLSRCQRFDLRRVDVETLTAHFKNICEQENTEAEDEAIALIARAADGSVRDGLSLLDQAMALGGETITAEQVQNMIGLGDRARNLDVLEKALTGNIKEALDVMDDLYKSGNDPLTLVQDMLDLTHTLTKLKAAPGSAETIQTMALDQITRLKKMAAEMSMPTLGKTWQLLLKGVTEVQTAPNAQNAAEMVIIRLSYAADLPDPKDLLAKLKSGGAAPVTAASIAAATPPPSAAPVAKATPSTPPPVSAVSSAPPQTSGSPQTVALHQTTPQPDQGPITINSLEDIIARLEAVKELILASQVAQYVHLVKLEPNRLEFRPADQAPQRLAQDLGQKLTSITGNRFIVSISQAQGQPTLAQQQKAKTDADYNAVLNTPIVQDILKVFPDAKLTDIITPETE